MVYRKTGGRIIAGPFTGLRFVYDSDGIPLVRLTAAEKYEVIRLVEGSDLSVRHTLRELQVLLGVHARMKPCRNWRFGWLTLSLRSRSDATHPPPGEPSSRPCRWIGSIASGLSRKARRLSATGNSQFVAARVSLRHPANQQAPVIL